MGGGSEYPQLPRADAARSLFGDAGVEGLQKGNPHLRGIVDMGSNGIRFSVSDLHPRTSRVLPTLISSRLDVSLYDAQYDDSGRRQPISDEVTSQVIAALLRFRAVCYDLGVQHQHMRIIATEATRTAINSEEYRRRIRNETGLEVEMLGKEEEGYVGALGIASGFSNVSGLVLDLGGGSMQITWLEMCDGEVLVSDGGSVSFPYGAAALTKRLEAIKKGKTEKEAQSAVDALRAEMKFNLGQAYTQLGVPSAMEARAIANGGFPLYISGGGFRGWGYLLLHMSQVHGRHYPISLVNGFTAPHKRFADVDALKKVAKQAHNIFRVSDRRRAQVPAVAFLVNVLSEALPHGIDVVHFAQGGVREGVLFRELDPDVRAQDPLETATRKFARYPSAEEIASLLKAAVPEPVTDPDGNQDDKKPRRRNEVPASFTLHVLHAFSNLLYAYDALTKETAAAAALYSTSTGLMCGTHGISHADRALMALLLAERYGEDLPPREAEFKESLAQLLTDEEVWWTKYLGSVGGLLAAVYPAGVVGKSAPRMRLSSEWAEGLGRKGKKNGIRLTFAIRKMDEGAMGMQDLLEGKARDIEKVGKKKRWVGGRHGWGMGVDVVINNVKDLH